METTPAAAGMNRGRQAQGMGSTCTQEPGRGARVLLPSMSRNDPNWSVHQGRSYAQDIRAQSYVREQRYTPPTVPSNIGCVERGAAQKGMPARGGRGRRRLLSTLGPWHRLGVDATPSLSLER
jgi:hypothetical protein